MPTYAYECQACNHGFEEFQSMTAKALRKCPECKTLKLQRLIGPGAGIIFKGSGFYETDYRSESYKNGQKADTEKSSSADKASSESKSDGKSDSKSGGESGGESTSKGGAEAKSEGKAKSGRPKSTRKD